MDCQAGTTSTPSQAPAMKNIKKKPILINEDLLVT